MPARSSTTSALRLPAAALLAASLVTAALAVPAQGTAWSRQGTVDPGLTTVGRSVQSVVVSGAEGAGNLVRQAVRSVGATHVRDLPIVNGVSVDIPADRVARLAELPGVTAVTLNRRVQMSGSSWDDSTSASSYAWTSGAAQTWGAGTGAGVSVAVLDTGVSKVNDLSGRVLSGPDLSGENQNQVDSYGHGTVMAGIIAGNGADSQPSPRTGVAPGATIISVKVAGANGSTDVSTVLAGLSWVGAFKDTYNIRVLNLSWGVPSTQDPRVDPLNYGVERLWKAGVVVVAAAGNGGPNPGTILKPADDPLVLTVGAYDDKGDSVSTNDTVPAWSAQGPTAQGLAKPDLVAPGRTLIATRAPGSTVETQNPKALVGSSYIKGSGTSEAAAVVSGVAALLIAAHPTWRPGEVKYALTSTASPLPNVSRSLQGAGRVQGAAATAADVSAAPVSAMTSDASGSLNASRGTGNPVSATCNGTSKTLNDETTSWCGQWLSTAWTSTAWTSTAWTSTAWTSTAWTADAWSSTAWTSTAWTSTAWTSTAWTSTAWTGSGWSSTAWTSTAWTSTAWTSAAYDDETAFLSAFWGDHPKSGRRLPGEVEANPSGHRLDQS